MNKQHMTELVAKIEDENLRREVQTLIDENLAMAGRIVDLNRQVTLQRAYGDFHFKDITA